MIHPAPTNINSYAAIGFGAAALLITGLQPIILGAMIAVEFIDLSQAGLIAMAEILCLGLGAGIAPLVLSPKWARNVLVASIGGLTIVNYLSSTALDFTGLISFRAVAGLCSGTLIWVVTSTFVRMTLADRRAGVFLVISTLIQAIIALGFALIVVPVYGWQGCFLSLAILSALPLFLTRHTIPALSPLPTPIKTEGRLTPKYIFVGALTLFHLCAIGSIWAFLEPLGVSNGISVRLIELTVGFTLLAQVVGGSFGAWLSPKTNSRVFILMTIAVQLLIAIYLGSASLHTTASFVILVMTFGGLWLFLLPFQFKLSLTIDPTGRLTTIIPALQLFGGALGPLVVSLIIGENPASAAWAAAGFFLLALAMLALVSFQRVRTA